MKLTPDSINQLDALVQTAVTAGIFKLVIADGKIRGIDQAQSVVIITSDGVPDFDGKQVGINRLTELAARLNLVKSQGALNIEATEADGGTDISLLEMNSGKTKAQFRCASVQAVKGVPKNITDTLVWEIKVGSKLLPTLSQAVSAMGSPTVTIASRDGKNVSFECVDGNKDVFTTDSDDAPLWVGTGAADTSFCYKYPAKTLLTLVKESAKTVDPVTLKIGQGGILSLKVNGFDFFVIPPQ